MGQEAHRITYSLADSETFGQRWALVISPQWLFPRSGAIQQTQTAILKREEVTTGCRQANYLFPQPDRSQARQGLWLFFLTVVFIPGRNNWVHMSIAEEDSSWNTVSQ